jgi:Zn-dependent peptidase ImmA (M78 family)
MIRSREARRRAREVLKMTNATAPPVDVHAIARFLRFDVIEFEFPDTISAVTFIEEGVKSIGVNKAQAYTRQHFSIAHELGHYLSGHEAYDHSRIHVEDRPGWLDPYNQQESEANEFAAELLMPEPFLRQDVARYGLDVPALAQRYEVSEQAMWIQLIDLRLASRYAKE